MTAQADSRAPVLDWKPRCRYCNKKLANYLARPWSITCVRCKTPNAAGLVSGPKSARSSIASAAARS
jgi:phage FluMu protein Com